jgi:DNA repair exonuclease SbcCD nuclease subunit
MKIGIIGDPHFRQQLSYADTLPDHRITENQDVLDAAVKALKDCDSIVFMGDNFDVKTNGNEVIRDFTAFVERFTGKNIYILAGNHEKSANGVSAIDYLKKIKNPKWKVITDTVTTIGELTFCPYFFRQELQMENNQEATEKLVRMIYTASEPTPPFQPKKARFLFVHHAISDTLTVNNASTNLFDEIVLPKKELESYFEFLIGGHIHRPGQYGNTLIAGSLFSQEAGDRNNKVWTFDTETKKVTGHAMPTRPIIKLDEGTAKALEDTFKLTKNYAIVKVVLTRKIPDVDMEALKKAGAKFDAFILQEQYPREREKKSATEDNLLEANIETLIRHYALTKKLDPKVLLEAWEKIAL